MKKKLAAILLCIGMVANMALPLVANDTEDFVVMQSETGVVNTSSWDGSIAESFNGGSGTKNDPYQIATASQFAYFIDSINTHTYENEYIELTNDIYINDETFTFDYDTGLIVINEGDTTFYCGSGIKGQDTVNGNIQFDTSASTLNSFYTYNDETLLYEETQNNKYPNAIYTLPYDSNTVFKGVLEGNDYIISGLYNSYLFSEMYGTISDLDFVECYSRTNESIITLNNYGTIENCSVSGINTYYDFGTIAYQNNNLIDNCASYVSMISSTCGGISKTNHGTISGSVNNGTFYYSSGGGIVANNKGEVLNSVNNGDFISCADSGGIAGSISAYSDDYITIISCTNNGDIKGTDNIAGICNKIYCQSSENKSTVIIDECINTGDIISDGDNIGGIIAYCEGDDDHASITVSKCQNHGNIFGLENVGGIIGHTYIENNHRDSASAIYIEYNYNTGEISGEQFIGGIVGYSYLWYWCYTFINDSYNIGEINSSSHAGGIVGYMDASFMNRIDIQNVYNIGRVVSTDENVGAISSRIYSAATTIL